jgi:hypothetical protein
MTTADWAQISRTLDYIMAQPTGKQIKDSPGAQSIKGEPEKPKRRYSYQVWWIIPMHPSN